MKAIKINTPDGQYFLPLYKVAKHRADCYYNKTLFPLDYKEQIDFIMNDDFEGINWLINNTDHYEWLNDLIKINSIVKVNFEDFWSNTEDFELIEHL